VFVGLALSACPRWKTLKISGSAHHRCFEGHLPQALKTSRPSLLARLLGAGRPLRKLVRVPSVARLVRHAGAGVAEVVRAVAVKNGETLAVDLEGVHAEGLEGVLVDAGLAGGLAGDLAVLARPVLGFFGFDACGLTRSGRRFPCTKRQRPHRLILESRPTKQALA